MDTIWIAMILYATLLFSLAGWLGRRSPGWQFWHWVDIPYYTLGAVAVVMFFAADRNIRLEQIEAQRQRLHQEWLSRPNLPPDVRLRPTPSALVLQYYRGLEVVVDHGEACKQIGSVDCPARIQVGDAVATAFQGFVAEQTNEPEQQARLEEDFCTRVYRLVDALDQSGRLDAGAYRLLKTALARQRREHAAPSDAAAGLEAEIRKAQQALLTQLHTTIRSDASTIMAAHGESAVFLFNMTASCADRPADQNEAIRRLSAWRTEADRRLLEHKKLSAAVERATQTLERTLAQRIVKSLEENIWPFLILLALALKFGKSMADITSKRRPVETQEAT